MSLPEERRNCAGHLGDLGSLCHWRVGVSDRFSIAIEGTWPSDGIHLVLLRDHAGSSRSIWTKATSCADSGPTDMVSKIGRFFYQTNHRDIQGVELLICLESSSSVAQFLGGLSCLYFRVCKLALFTIHDSVSTQSAEEVLPHTRNHHVFAVLLPRCSLTGTGPAEWCPDAVWESIFAGRSPVPRIRCRLCPVPLPRIRQDGSDNAAWRKTRSISPLFYR